MEWVSTCEYDLRGAGVEFGLSQTLGAKGNLTKFLGGENGGRSGHFHLQAAFQRLNTVFLVGLTGLSVETLPGSFATNSCDWRSPQLLGRHFPCTYKPANLAGSRQRTVRDSVRTTPQRYLFLGSTRYYTIFCHLIRLSHDINDIL